MHVRYKGNSRRLQEDELMDNEKLLGAMRYDKRRTGKV